VIAVNGSCCRVPSSCVCLGLPVSFFLLFAKMMRKKSKGGDGGDVDLSSFRLNDLVAPYAPPIPTASINSSNACK
jgi:hypothetical protein